MNIQISSNEELSEQLVQTMKKQCCQLGNKKKSFKERNPDLNMEEIQANPGIPDEIKEVLSGALTFEEDEEESGETTETTEESPDKNKKILLQTIKPKAQRKFMSSDDDGK